MGFSFAQLEIARPLWLALLLVLAPAVYYWRRSLVRISPRQRAVALVIHVSVIVLLVAAACGIKVARRSSEQCVVFAVDRSRNIGDEALAASDDFVRRAMQHAGASRTAVLPFAGRAGKTEGNDAASLQPERTNLAAAIAAARAAVPAEYVGQIVLLTDGNASQGDAAAAAEAAGMPVSVVPLPSRTSKKCVVFAVDRSRSIGPEARAAADKFLRQAMQHAGAGRAVVLPFAGRAGAAVAGRPDAGADASLQRQQTDIAVAITACRAALPAEIAGAVAAARAAIPEEYVGQIVLLSDGNATQGDAAAAAEAAGVPVSVVPLAGCPAQEVYVSAVVAPEVVRPGESFPVEVRLQSTHDDEGTVELLQGDKVVLKERRKMARGESRLDFQQTVSGGETVTLTARIGGFRDTEAENNSLATTVGIARRPRVLLIESETVPVFAAGTVPVFAPAKTGLSPSAPPSHNSPLKAALEGGHIDVDLVPPEKMPRRLEDLRSYDVLILSNVPAAALGDGRMELLSPYVRDFGGGLVLIGGDQTFTPGGYRGTPLEQVLPLVSHERKDKPKPSLAQVLVLDCSESMDGESIALARQAARRAVENLGPNDQIGILTFHDQCQWATPLRRCSDADKRQVLKQIDSIAAGGRTNMYPAMERAFLALHEADADLKHMLVMTDGTSDPDDFAGLTRRIAEDGITVSTVGVGPKVAREFLSGIAKSGKGRSYFCKTAADMPQVFALETISAGRVGITEEPFEPQVEQSAAEYLAGVELAEAPRLLGYAETKIKPGSRLLMTTAAGDPLLAFHPYGQGKCVAFASDAQPRWAAAWIERPAFFAPFWRRVVRQAMPPLNPGELSKAVRGGPAAGYADELRFRPTNTDLLRAIARLSGGQYAPAPADVFAASDRSVPGFRPTNTALLRSIARQSGGQYDPDAAAVFAPSDRTVPRTLHLWPYLLAAAMLLFVANVALRRFVLP